MKAYDNKHKTDTISINRPNLTQVSEQLTESKMPFSPALHKSIS